MANSIFLNFGGFTNSGGGNVSTPGIVSAGSVGTGSFRAADGISTLPSYSFTSEPTLGFWRSAAGVMTLQGAFVSTGNITSGASVLIGAGGNFELPSARFVLWASRATIGSGGVGQVSINTSDTVLGSVFNVSALPTVASGFGTSPSITAKSTPTSGSINVGTGGVATTGVINFNGTAFPFAPFVVVTCSAGAVPTIATTSTTQLTLTTSVAWPASTIVNWHVIGGK